MKHPPAPQPPASRDVGRALAFVTLLAACAGGGGAPPTEGSGSAGSAGAAGSSAGGSGGAAATPCKPEEDACKGNVLLRCVSGKVTSTPCDDAACTAMGKGAAVGCALDDKDQPYCQCGCTPADNRCEGANLLGCSKDGAIRTYVCDADFCKAQGFKGGIQPGASCDANAKYCACLP